MGSRGSADPGRVSGSVDGGANDARRLLAAGTPGATVRKDALVLAAAVGLVGVTFGVVANSAGIGLLKAIALSFFVFTGASQFAAVGVIAAGGSVASAVTGALLLAARNGLYGMRMSSLLRSSRPPAAAGAQLVIDESTAVALAQRTPKEQRIGFWWAGLGVFGFWNLGTVIGVLLGDVVGDPLVYGLDAVFPASFVALMMPHIESSAGRVAAGLGAVVALIGIPVLPAGVPVLVAALAVIPAYLFFGGSAASSSPPVTT